MAANTWSPERVEKAQRLVARTMMFIAEQMHVSTLELIEHTIDRLDRAGALTTEAGFAFAPIGIPGAEAKAERALADGPEHSKADGPAPVTLGPADELPPAAGPVSAPDEPSAEPSADLVAWKALGRAGRIRLRDRSGRYLHEDGEHFIRDVQWAWCGTEAQCATLKRRNPAFRRLIEERVQ